MEKKRVEGKIDWLPSEPNEYPKGSGEYNIGIKVHNEFYNQYDTFDKLKKLLTRIKVGFEVRLDVIGNKIEVLEVISDKVEKSNKPGSFAEQLEKVNYKTLMNKAHQIGLQSTKVELVTELTDISKKQACFKATVTIARKTINEDKSEEIQYQVFEDYGEACGLETKDGGNIDSKQIRSAYIRMASTRALVRALRQACNNMETAEEELPSGELPSDK